MNEKIKVEGLKRKKRRMRLKAKGTSDAIEKFIAQSSKSAKYAKTTVKKRDMSEAGKSSAIEVKRLDGPPSAGASHATPASSNAGGINVTPLDNPTSAGSAGAGVPQVTIGSTNNASDARAHTDAHSTGGGTGN